MNEQISADPYSGILEQFLQLSSEVKRALMRTHEAPSSHDLIFIGTATAPEIAGVARWLSECGTQPQTALLFRWSDPGTFGEGMINPAVLRYSMKLLLSATGRRPWIGATNESLARALTPVVAQRPEITPSLTFFGRPIASRIRAPGQTRLSVLGASRPNKGNGVIPALIQAIRERNMDARLVVHGCAKPIPFLIRRQLSVSDEVRVIPGRVTNDEFDDLIEASDFVILPYSREVYRTMVSGVFTKVVGAGRPAVVPSGTWMADRVLCGDAAGHVYDGDGAGAIFRALEEVAPRREEYRARALARAASWREEYDGRKLVEQLLELMK
jgi:glycosyltransferase involved in cell wall biosynthesis